jgi:hypothetical protein
MTAGQVPCSLPARGCSRTQQSGTMDRSGWSTPVRGFAAFWVNDFFVFCLSERVSRQSQFYDANQRRGGPILKVLEVLIYALILLHHQIETLFLNHPRSPSLVLASSPLGSPPAKRATVSRLSSCWARPEQDQRVAAGGCAGPRGAPWLVFFSLLASRVTPSTF